MDICFLISWLLRISVPLRGMRAGETLPKQTFLGSVSRLGVKNGGAMSETLHNLPLIFSVSMQSEEGVPYFGPRTFLNLFQFETTLRDWRGGRTAQKRLSGAQLTIQLFFLLSQMHNKFTEMLLVTAFVVT